MRKLLAIAACALAILANASDTPVKIGAIQVVETSGLTAAVMKLGEISGNSMFGAMAAARIAELPSNAFFGPTRQGASVYLPVYIDLEDVAEMDDAEDLDDSLDFAVVYPVAVPKDEFLAMHPSAVETNGMIRVYGEMFAEKDEWDEDSVTYVAFSDNGKWLVASEKPGLVALAMGDVASAERAMGDDVVRCDILPRGMAVARKFVKDGETSRLIEGLDSAFASLRIGDAGIDVYGAYRFADGSELSKYGSSFLPENPFAFDDGSAVCAAANSYNDQSGLAKLYNDALAVVARNGLDLSSIVTCAEDGDTCRVSFDPAAFFARFANPTNKLDQIDADKIGAEINALGTKPPSPAEKTYNCAMSISGYRPRFTAAQRFAYILPEMSGKKLCYAYSCSLCAIVQAVASACVAAIDDPSQRAALSPFVGLLPKENIGGVAAADWRDGDLNRYMVRISADELRSAVAGCTAVFTYAMMANMSANIKQIDEDAGEDCRDDEEEDFDDDDED